MTLIPCQVVQGLSMFLKAFKSYLITYYEIFWIYAKQYTRSSRGEARPFFPWMHTIIQVKIINKFSDGQGNRTSVLWKMRVHFNQISYMNLNVQCKIS